MATHRGGTAPSKARCTESGTQVSASASYQLQLTKVFDVSVADQPLIEQLSLAGSDATISKLITQIVNSKQFRNRRDTVDE